jgi:hypothetical protein
MEGYSHFMKLKIKNKNWVGYIKHAKDKGKKESE